MAGDAKADDKPVKSKKGLIIILAAVLVVVLAGGGGAFIYFKKKAEAEAAAAEESEGEAPVKKPVVKKKSDDKKTPPVFLPVDPFTVNLADRDGSRYAQVAFSLEVDEAKTGDQLKQYMPAIRGNVLLLLSEKKAADLLSPEGKILLAKEIRREVLKPLVIDAPVEDEEDDPPPTSKRKRRVYVEPDYPVRGVHFSNVIVQ